jgi:hypothetical protein
MPHLARPPSKRALWEVTVAELLAGFYESDGRGRRAPESRGEGGFHISTEFNHLSSCSRYNAATSSPWSYARRAPYLSRTL